MNPSAVPNAVPKDKKENLVYRMELNNSCLKSQETVNIVKELCKKDCVFFFNSFLWTYDPRTEEKELPFVLYDYQEDFIRWCEELYAKKQDGLIEKTRDMGATWVILGFIFKHWLFDGGFTSHLGSKTEDDVDRTGDPKSLFWKLRYLRSHLPIFLQPQGFDIRTDDMYMRLINPENQSVISGESANPNFSRAGRYSIILLDEFAVHEYAEDVWTASADSSPCRVVVSTPKGTGNKFWDLRYNTGIKHKTLHWTLHPTKNEGLKKDRWGHLHSKWYDAECSRRSKTDIAQELDINYLEAGNPFFSIEALLKQQEHQPLIGDLVLEEHRVVFRETSVGKIRLFSKVFTKDFEQLIDGVLNKGIQAAIGADASEGVPEGDFSALCALDKKSNNTILSYRGKLKPDEFAYLLYLVARFLNNSMVACESGGYGCGVNEDLWRLGVNLYKEQDFSEGFVSQKQKLGFSTNARTRPAILAQLEEEIRNQSTELRDILLINECKNFIVKDGRAQAATGSHDDFIFARAIAGELRKRYPYQIEKTHHKSRGQWQGKYTKHRVTSSDRTKYSKNYAGTLAYV